MINRLASIGLITLLGLTSSLRAATSLTMAQVEAMYKDAPIVFDLPFYENSVEALKQTEKESLAAADAALAALVAQDPSKATLASTFKAFDRIVGNVTDTAQRVGLIQGTHPEKAVRDAAAEVDVALSSWLIALEYREDIYRVLKAFIDTKPTLTGQDLRNVEETMRDYRRAGLELPADQRAAIEAMRKTLTEMVTKFQQNIAGASSALTFTAAELDGVPDSFLSSPGVKQDNGTYKVMANVTWHYVAVVENAKNPETRRKLAHARGQLAREENLPLLTDMVMLRAKIAQALGYKTWADYQTETRMSGSATTALTFENELVAGLEGKMKQEWEELRQTKVKETGNASTQLEAWDIAYYTNLLTKEKYSIDTDALRVFFPYDATLAGMFRIYESIFGLTFAEVQPPQIWFPDVKLYLVTDTATRQPMGMFYLDMFPREGKYNHFACFGIRDQRTLDDGRTVLPLVSLVCNFPPPKPDQPSLLSHDDVETLFHEFGHVMHKMLGRSDYQRLSSFAVPRDFVEAPSQMLENWIRDKKVLDTFAADYRDPSKKIPADVIERLNDVRKATSGMFYRRQLSYGLLDLTLHTLPVSDVRPDVNALANGVLARVSYPPIPDTAFAAYFGHLAGYDAGYYGYLWALAIATDLASVFESAPNGFMDTSVGMRLRNEVYGAANTRDVNQSVEAFLGRPRSITPFLKFLGATPTAPGSN
ncbi:MAG TPA: M3 family metallopeptidase [Opitutaceae bacterium]